MKRYKLAVRKGPASGTFSRYASSEEEAISGWLEDNPTTQVVSCTLHRDEASIPKVCKSPSKAKSRAYLKARIAQMIRNAQFILEDEEALVTLEERVQLSRIICKQNRILALWPERTMQLKLEGLLD